MNFYLNLLNEQIKLKDENPSIGIILCASKDYIEVEYALSGISRPCLTRKNGTVNISAVRVNEKV